MNQKYSKVIDGQIVVDWSACPSASHYCPETDITYEGFLKVVDDTVITCNIHPTFGDGVADEDWFLDAEATPEDLEDEALPFIKKTEEKE